MSESVDDILFKKLFKFDNKYKYTRLILKL
jgi:hypothetical protein